MITLTKPIARTVTIDGQRVVVTLNPCHHDGDAVITFRHHRKTRASEMSIPLSRVYLLAAKLSAEQLRATRAAKREAR